MHFVLGNYTILVLEGTNPPQLSTYTLIYAHKANWNPQKLNYSVEAGTENPCYLILSHTNLFSLISWWLKLKIHLLREMTLKMLIHNTVFLTISKELVARILEKNFYIGFNNDIIFLFYRPLWVKAFRGKLPRSKQWNR